MIGIIFRVLKTTKIKCLNFIFILISLGVIGRDKYGVFPLRGKMLNVREASTKQLLENAEVSSLLKIIGLNFKEKYENKESLKNLRYGKLMIMTDQDHDGSHIKGLIINFVHHQWPNLLKHGFVEEVRALFRLLLRFFFILKRYF